MFVKLENFVINTDYIVFITPINIDFFKVELTDKHFVTIKNENQIELQKTYNKLIKQIGAKYV